MRKWNRVVAVAAMTVCVGTVLPARADELDVDPARVYRDLSDLVAIGLRSSTSPGAARARDLIAERLRQAGFKAERAKFSVGAPDSPSFALENVVGSQTGANDRVVVVVTHFDGLAKTPVEGQGASCDASGPAVLLELARQLGRQPLHSSVRLVFADGHWPLSNHPALFKGLYGSEDTARAMQREGALARVRSVFVVDHVGGRELRFANEALMTPPLRQLLFDQLSALGHADALDLGLQIRARDDHEPFVDEGARNVLALIGWSKDPGHSLDDRCRESHDDLAAIDRDNLATAARLAVRLVHELDTDR